MEIGNHQDVREAAVPQKKCGPGRTLAASGSRP